MYINNYKLLCSEPYFGKVLQTNDKSNQENYRYTYKK